MVLHEVEGEPPTSKRNQESAGPLVGSSLQRREPDELGEVKDVEHNSRNVLPESSLNRSAIALNSGSPAFHPIHQYTNGHRRI
jgi:hypothetical protein